MTLSFMIKKHYLAEKVAEQEAAGTFHERRAYKPFWRSRIRSINAWGPGDYATFLCGRFAFSAGIVKILVEMTPSGINDVVQGDVCYNIECKFLHEELEGLSLAMAQKIRAVL